MKIFKTWQFWDTLRSRIQTTQGWGSRFLLFIGVLALLAAPGVGILGLILPAGTFPLGATLWLYLSLLLLLGQWSGAMGDPWYGLSWQQWRWLGLGLLTGGGGLLLLYGIQGWLGWLAWQQIPWTAWLQTGLYGLGLGLGVALVEELLFRGWLLTESGSGWGSAVIFALLHFIRPWEVILATWVQFFGLVLMGLILNRARDVGSLNFPLGLHAGWVAVVSAVGMLDGVVWTGKVPPWVTGIGGNPLAGVIGLVGLGITGWLVHRLGADSSALLGGFLDKISTSKQKN